MENIVSLLQFWVGLPLAKYFTHVPIDEKNKQKKTWRFGACDSMCCCAGLSFWILWAMKIDVYQRNQFGFPKSYYRRPILPITTL